MTSIEAHVQQPYKYGFVTDIESEVVPAGLNEDVIRLISAKKGEPEWMLEWRLKAYRNWLKLSEPHWPNVKYGPIDYQAISYYAATKQRPKGVRCPLELSTYFRINASATGQFERTLIIADEGSYVSYLEGCSAPTRDENQLHAAVVELVAFDNAQIKYSTIQNWYPGDEEG